MGVMKAQWMGMLPEESHIFSMKSCIALKSKNLLFMGGPSEMAMVGKCLL